MPSSTRPGRPPTRTRSSPAATACSRSTRSTTARSPTTSSRSSPSAIADGQVRRGGVQRFPPRHLQPPHHPDADRRDPGRRATRSPTARWRAAGATSPIPGLRPDHAERARGALRARRPGLRRPAARLEPLRRRAMQDADPQARRPRRAHLPQRRPRVARLASSSSTASSTAWSTRSAPATRCSPTRRLRCWRPRSDVIATILGSMAAACECEMRRQRPGHADDVHHEDRRGRARRRTSIERLPMRVIVVGPRRSRAQAPRASPAPTSSQPSIRSIPEADYRRSARRSARRTTTRRWLCIPDEPKIELLDYLLGTWQARAGRKAAVAPRTRRSIAALQQLARAPTASCCYTAYNHRFEPHFVRMRDLIASGELGAIYSLPHVLRQRHGAAGARFGLARPGRRRAARSRLAPARHGALLVRRHRRRRSRSYRPTASRTARPTTSCSRRTARARSSNWK